MAIQTRRGNESDFDPNRMVPGEWATATDTEKVWMCFKTGKARRMATYEDMVENIGEATEEIKAEFTAGVKSATEAAARAANTANTAAEAASNASNTANAAAETAMNAAEKAEAAAGGDISEKTVSFEEVETYSKPTSGSKISSIIANLVMGISQLFSDLANKIDSSKILSEEEWGAAISERGYLADAKDVKDSLTQLNTNIANKTSLRGFSSGQKIDFDFRPFGRNIARMRVADTTMFDLVPNNADSSTNNKITNLKVDYSSTPWKLSVDVYIDGRTYTKTINFDA
jgi:hypothetical protein